MHALRPTTIRHLALLPWLAVTLFSVAPGWGQKSASSVRLADLASWHARPPDAPAPKVERGNAMFQGGSGSWTFLAGGEQYENIEAGAVVTLVKPATQFDFFGSSWSAWPPRDLGGDRGYEAAILLRATGKTGDDGSGYRVQLSHKYQDIALVKYP